MKSQLLQIGCKGNDFLSITPFCQLSFPGHYTFLTVWDIERKTALILSSEIHLICGRLEKDKLYIHSGLSVVATNATVVK